MDAELRSVARFVETERGHPFRASVRVELVDDAGFRARLLAGFDASTGSLRRQERILKLLGLLPESADLVEISRKFTAEEVIGFYDPDTTRLVIRSAVLNPFARVILAHEFTHALDDQWFGLHRPLIERDDERSFAFAALVEGSAQRVSRAYARSLTTQERDEATAESAAFAAGIDTSDVPTSVIELSDSPYTLGTVFVDDLVANGGLRALDAAFADPPQTTEQIMHPEKYYAHEAAVSVAVPPSDGRIVDQGELGELFITEFLNVAMAPARARQAATGWAGDRYVAWSSGAASACLRDDIATDTSLDKSELLSALRSWRFSRDRATVTDLSPLQVRLTVCG